MYRKKKGKELQLQIADCNTFPLNSTAKFSSVQEQVLTELFKSLRYSLIKITRFVTEMHKRKNRHSTSLYLMFIHLLLIQCKTVPLDIHQSSNSSTGISAPGEKHTARSGAGGKQEVCTALLATRGADTPVSEGTGTCWGPGPAWGFALGERFALSQSQQREQQPQDSFPLQEAAQ